MKRVLLSILVIGILLLSACGAPTTMPSESTPTLEVLAHWTGTGVKTTEPIIINKTPWVIEWSFVPEPILGMYANLLSVQVMQPDNSLYFKLPVNIANVKEVTIGSSYIYDKGTFYLDISSMGGSWDIIVYGYR